LIHSKDLIKKCYFDRCILDSQGSEYSHMYSKVYSMFGLYIECWS